MHAENRFSRLSPSFWANVQIINQEIGYTNRRTKAVKVHSLDDMLTAMGRIGLDTAHLITAEHQPTPLARQLYDYFAYRAHILDTYVEPCLMNAERAEAIYNQLRAQYKPTYPMPSGRGRGEAFLAGIVNILIESHSDDLPFDYEPRNLVTFTDGMQPVATLPRRVDGCFTESVNPIAIWEVKEYYFNKSFSSHISDSLYDTQLNGIELVAAREHSRVSTRYILMVDSHYIWWVAGRAYLCRLIDMLHIGYVDEILFGSEVLERLPQLIQQWTQA